MEPVTVLLIEDGAAETTLLFAALVRRRPEIRVLESKQGSDPVALAIAGARALSEAPDELVKTLQAEGIPVVGIASGLSQADKRRALAAGVREIHERPTEWRPYSELIDSVLTRFIRTDSPPRRGPTS